MLREINLNELYQISLCIPPVYLECTLFFYLASLIYYWLPIKKKKMMNVQWQTEKHSRMAIRSYILITNALPLVSSPNHT